MTHGELLAAASVLHEEALLHLEAAEAAAKTAEADLAQARERIAVLEAGVSQRIAELEAKVAELTALLDAEPEPEPDPVPEPDENWLLRETFAAALDPRRFIFLCHDPGQNFLWRSPGNLDVVFVAGKTTGTAIDSSSGRILRSEVEWRKLGETTGGVPQGIEVGKEYVAVVDITIPADYDPRVSGESNEKRNLFQMWERDVKPFALELIRLGLPPGDGKTDFLRLVVGGAPRWIQPVAAGNRYRLTIRTLLHTSAGSLRVNLNGTDYPAYNGRTCFGSTQMVPHWGLYLPASGSDPVGGKTVITFHEVGIRLA